MTRENLRDIYAFLNLARERSFTRAAAQLGISQSALSHAIRGLEERLGLRLLTRTTRSVAPTEAGKRLIQMVTTQFDAITEELAAFNELRDKPSGTVRITTSDFAANTVLWPKLSKLLPQYPDVKIEIAIDPGLTDIVTDRYDAGVRFGDQISKDMTAVRITPDIRMAIVGAPSYIGQKGLPRTPADLMQLDCVNMRFSSGGGMYAWELKRGKRNLRVRVAGQWTFNCVYPALETALAGLGMAYVPEELAQPHIEAGRLHSVMKDWCPTFPGLHIFYASKRHSSPALSLVVETLRYHRPHGI